MTTDSADTEPGAGPKGLFIVGGAVKEVTTSSSGRLSAST